MKSRKHILIDAENIIFSALNKNRELIRTKHTCTINNFPAQSYFEPVVEATLTKITGFDRSTDTIDIVVGYQNRSLIQQSTKYQVHIAHDPQRTGIDNQAADRFIRTKLINLFWNFEARSNIILVSGDGGYLPSLLQLHDRGYAIQIVAPSWTLNHKYAQYFGSQVLQLDYRWLDDVRARITRQKPRIH